MIEGGNELVARDSVSTWAWVGNSGMTGQEGNGDREGIWGYRTLISEDEQFEFDPTVGNHNCPLKDCCEKACLRVEC